MTKNARTSQLGDDIGSGVERQEQAGEPLVTRPHAVMAGRLQVLQEVQHALEAEVSEAELGDLPAGVLCHEPQEESQSVAIAAHGRGRPSSKLRPAAKWLSRCARGRIADGARTSRTSAWG